jgi:Protein of unknown function (DUF2961)
VATEALMMKRSLMHLSSRRTGLSIAVAFIIISKSTVGFAQNHSSHAPQGLAQVGLLDSLFLLQNTKTARISTWDQSGGNDDFIYIAPGTTRTIAEIPNAGVIRRFYVAFLGADRMRWRKLVLRMYWDGQKTPAVEVPLGDFFGAGLGTIRHFQSLAVSINPSMTEGDFDGVTSYLPMPFEHGARITVENDGNIKDFVLFYHIEYERYAPGQLPSSSLSKIHSSNHRARECKQL